MKSVNRLHHRAASGPQSSPSSIPRPYTPKSSLQRRTPKLSQSHPSAFISSPSPLSRRCEEGVGGCRWWFIAQTWKKCGSLPRYLDEDIGCCCSILLCACSHYHRIRAVNGSPTRCAGSRGKHRSGYVHTAIKYSEIISRDPCQNFEFKEGCF